MLGAVLRCLSVSYTFFRYEIFDLVFYWSFKWYYTSLARYCSYIAFRWSIKKRFNLSLFYCWCVNPKKVLCFFINFGTLKEIVLPNFFINCFCLSSCCSLTAIVSFILLIYYFLYYWLSDLWTFYWDLYIFLYKWKYYGLSAIIVERENG